MELSSADSRIVRERSRIVRERERCNESNGLWREGGNARTHGNFKRDRVVSPETESMVI